MLTKIANKLSYTGNLIRFFAFLLCLTGGQILFELQSVETYQKVWEPVEQSLLRSLLSFFSSFLFSSYLSFFSSNLSPPF